MKTKDQQFSDLLNAYQMVRTSLMYETSTTIDEDTETIRKSIERLRQNFEDARE